MKPASHITASVASVILFSCSLVAQTNAEKSGAAARREAEKAKSAAQQALPVVKQNVGAVVQNAQADLQRAAPVVKEKAAAAGKALENVAVAAGRDFQQAAQKTSQAARDFAAGWKKEDQKIKHGR